MTTYNDIVNLRTRFWRIGLISHRARILASHLDMTGELLAKVRTSNALCNIHVSPLLIRHRSHSLLFTLESVKSAKDLESIAEASYTCVAT